MSSSSLYRSVNPKNNKLLKTYETISSTALEKNIEASYQRFRQNYTNKDHLPERFERMAYLSRAFTERKQEFASIITTEMGKPINQAKGELDRIIAHLNFYIANTERFLEDEHLDVTNPNHTGYIKHFPLGPTLGKS